MNLTPLTRRLLPVAVGFAAVAGLVAFEPAAANALPYGPYTCKQGFVWRDSYNGDTVCVTPQDRTEAATQNGFAASHRSANGGAYGPDTCLQGYVWRETKPSDHVCVIPSERDKARKQNSEGIRNLEDPTGVPRGGVNIRTELNQLGGDIYVNGGSGLTANAQVDFYATNLTTGYAESLGSRQADGNGQLAKENYVLETVRCEIPAGKQAVIVVVDLKTGIVKSAGNTSAYSCRY